MLYKFAAKKTLSKEIKDEDARKRAALAALTGFLAGTAGMFFEGGLSKSLKRGALLGAAAGGSTLIDHTYRKLRGYGYKGVDNIKAKAELNSILGGLLGAALGARRGPRAMLRNGLIGAALGGAFGGASGAADYMIEKIY